MSRRKTEADALVALFGEGIDLAIATERLNTARALVRAKEPKGVRKVAKRKSGAVSKASSAQPSSGTGTGGTGSALPPTGTLS